MKRQLTTFIMLVGIVFAVPAGEGLCQALPLSAHTAAAGADSRSNPPTLPDRYSVRQIEGILAVMGDDQVRRLLLEELRRSASDSNEDRATDGGKGLIGMFVQSIEHAEGLINQRLGSIRANAGRIPGDIAEAVNRMDKEGGGIPLWGEIVLSLLLLIIALGFERLCRRSIGPFVQSAPVPTPPQGFLKFWTALLHRVPNILSILVLALAGVLLVLLVHGLFDTVFEMIFLTLLAAIVFVRLAVVVLQMLFSPSDAAIRLIPMDDETAAYFNKNAVRLAFLWISESALSACLFRLGIVQDGIIMLKLLVGSTMAAMIAAMAWRARFRVARWIVVPRSDTTEALAGLRKQLAGIWHMLALAYVILVWLAWACRLMIVGPAFDPAATLSLLIVPLYLLFDRIGQWIISTYTAAVGRDGSAAAGDGQGEGKSEHIFRRIVRISIAAAVAVWLLTLWGVPLPYAKIWARATFNIMLICLAALIAWQFITRAINNKMMETAGGESQEASEDDEGFGAPVLDRSQTFLPVVKKFIASMLVAVVAMVVLSSIGIHIGPLLAGAGVIGLAIGFGAQKLVSDILSGFFFLLDDTFRIGEYITAGSVSGSVERITLRNLWLRHHRGMLQIVPFSDLGSITNFMRGAIHVKFNLEFPYGTDVDKVRKIIKKVGKKMLQDEELGKDLVKPVKSQGIRNVGNSVMTFRVKFSAKPGAHFLIRREAYRRITEALQDAGISYAHRRVIVDIPQDDMEDIDPDDQNLSAGAAAALDAMATEEQAKTAGERGKQS